MLIQSIEFLASQLDEYLIRTNKLEQSVVAIAPFIEQGLGKPESGKNKIMLSLVNMEKITTPIIQQRTPENVSHHSVTEQPLFFDLSILMAANFDESNHRESLKLLSDAISYFQRRPVFNRQNSPSLDRRIEKLVLQVQNLNINELGSLWGMLGRKYMPSILYKVHLITYYEQDTQYTEALMSQSQGAAAHG